MTKSLNSFPSFYIKFISESAHLNILTSKFAIYGYQVKIAEGNFTKVWLGGGLFLGAAASHAVDHIWRWRIFLKPFNKPRHYSKIRSKGRIVTIGHFVTSPNRLRKHCMRNVSDIRNIDLFIHASLWRVANIQFSYPKTCGKIDNVRIQNFFFWGSYVYTLKLISNCLMLNQIN